MKRAEKNAISRQRILEAAREEFAKHGYDGASLNTACAEKGISKGIVYHYFASKDELYLACAADCFDGLTAALEQAAGTLHGTPAQRLGQYFDARLRYFAGHPDALGIFADAALHPPVRLAEQLAQCRRAFDRLSAALLTGLLEGQKLRPGLTVEAVVEDFRLYMDYFNLHFQTLCRGGGDRQTLLREHEERCRRQLDILLYGVLGD